MSKPTMIGYMNGLALTILVGQLPKLLGFKAGADGLIGDIAGFAKGLANGDAVPAATATGLAAVAVILVLQRWLPKVPAVLIAVVAAIAATTVLTWPTRSPTRRRSPSAPGRKSAATAR
jgi:MFS superfamily sulfate permease-like transporter